MAKKKQVLYTIQIMDLFSVKRSLQDTKFLLGTLLKLVYMEWPKAVLEKLGEVDTGTDVSSFFLEEGENSFQQILDVIATSLTKLWDESNSEDRERIFVWIADVVGGNPNRIPREITKAIKTFLQVWLLEPETFKKIQDLFEEEEARPRRILKREEQELMRLAGKLGYKVEKNK